MARSSLKESAIKYYKHAPVDAWVIGLTSGIVIAALVALDLLIPALSFLVFPLVILPIIFSASLQFINIKSNQQVTAASALKGFGLYFRSDFFGSFSYFLALIKSIFTFIATEIILSSIISFAFMSFVPSFSETTLSVYEMLQSENLEIESLNAIFEMNGGILFTYFCAVFFPSMAISLVYFIYNLSRSSIMIYYRLHVRGGHPRLIRYTYNDARRRNMGRMIRDYLSLNWPLYLLVILGFAGGAIGGYFWQKDIMTMFACSLIGAALLLAFFLPFYFGNQQAFYDYYVDEFKQSTENVSQMLLKNIESNIAMSEEEKEKLEEALSDVKNSSDKEEDEDDYNKEK